MIRLDPSEVVLIVARRHPAPALDRQIAIALLTLGGAVILALNDSLLIGAALVALGALPLLVAWIGWRRDIVVVTDRRLVHRFGIISTNSSETAIERIGDVRISQGLLGRLLDYGDLEVVAGSDLGADRLRELRGPERVAAAIRAARDR